MPSELMFFRPLKRRAAYETKPKDGSFYAYTHYREAIAEDCECRCVYCDCHEDIVGGREAMEMDHFRPWGKAFGPSNERRFEHLKNEPRNLVHACGVCNGFKSSHWPTEDPDRPYDHEKGWIDPFEERRADFLEVRADGNVYAKKAPGQYQIKKLRLNRALLKRQRELRMLLDTWKITEEKWQTIVEQEPGTATAQIAAEALRLLRGIRKLLNV